MFLYNRFSFSFFFLFLSTVPNFISCSLEIVLLLHNCRNIKFQVDEQLILFL